MQMMNSEVLVGSVEHVSIVAVKVQGGSGRLWRVMVVGMGSGSQAVFRQGEGSICGG